MWNMRFLSACRQHRALAWLWLIQMVSMGAMEMSGPFWTLHLQQSSRLTNEQLIWFGTIAYGGPMLTAMLCTPWWGRLGDRVGHRWMLMRALLALTFTQFWVVFCTDPLWILLIRLLQGAIAGFIAAAQAYGSTLTTREQRKQLMASLQIATAVGSVMGPVAGGWIYQHLGFSAVNLLAAVLCAACLLATWALLPATDNPSPQRGSDNQTDTALWQQGYMPGLLMGILLIQAARMLPQSYYAIYVDQVLHQPPGFTGFSYAMAAMGLCISAPFWAIWFSRQSDRGVLRQVMVICLLSAGILVLQSLGFSPSVFLLCRFAWGVFLGALLPVFYSQISANCHQSQQGQALALGNSAAKAGALTGTLLGALLMALISLKYLFLMVAVIYVLTAIYLFCMQQKNLLTDPFAT